MSWQYIYSIASSLGLSSRRESLKSASLWDIPIIRRAKCPIPAKAAPREREREKQREKFFTRGAFISRDLSAVCLAIVMTLSWMNENFRKVHFAVLWPFRRRRSKRTDNTAQLRGERSRKMFASRHKVLLDYWKFNFAAFLM